MIINMISKGEEVKGQGVGSAYFELIKLIQLKLSDKYQIAYNDATKADFNHIHTIHPKCYWQMKTSKKPSCMHVHFLPETVEGSIKLPKAFQSIFYRYIIHFYKEAQELIVVNPIFIEPLNQYGIEKDKITYIPNVVATKDFYPKEISEPSALFKKYDLSLEKFTVVSVGQVQTRKGVLDFIDIAKQLPDVQFIWAGGFSFGKITDGYEKLTAVIENPPANVKFVGIVNREEMNDLYNACDLLLTTSYNELFPVSILEAVNSGLPILVRDLDLYEKIYFTDYLKAHSNEEFIRLIEALKTQPETMEKALAASKKIASDYSEENVAQLWEDYYTHFYQRWVK